MIDFSALVYLKTLNCPRVEKNRRPSGGNSIFRHELLFKVGNPRIARALQVAYFTVSYALPCFKFWEMVTLFADDSVVNRPHK